MNAYTKLYLVEGSRIRALLECASDGDVRHYLNGICWEPKRQRFLATDGHILGVCKAPGWYADGVDFPAGGLLIPRDLLEQFKKAKTLSFSFSLQDKQITKTSNPADWQVQIIADNGATNTAPCIDGAFPDVDRVIPTKLAGEWAHFLPSMLDRLVKINKALANKKRPDSSFALYPNDRYSAGIATFADDFFAVCMPGRVEQHEWPGLPDWFANPAPRAVADDMPPNVVCITPDGPAELRAA